MDLPVYENDSINDESKNVAIHSLLLSIYEKHLTEGTSHRNSVADSSIESEFSYGEGCKITWRGADYSSTCSEADIKQTKKHTKSSLDSMDPDEINKILVSYRQKASILSSRLIRQLKRRDHRSVRFQKKCDIITAILQAASQKRRQDTQLKFTIEPKPGIEAFQQWKDAMKAVARLQSGIPPEFRKRVWLALANHHISHHMYDWERVVRFAFNDRSNPDDDTLGLQIVKDLHRTGCDRFCSEADQAVLKRVLLAYARWNKRVGYCQGFNVLAALILEVTDRQEDDALKVMVYLVDHVLPESYFSQNLQALSVDMAVFRDLLAFYIPHLAKHLESLQNKASTNNKIIRGGANRNYEPPLTNVFTMQWFLTLFATCLPPDAVLRVWDSVLLEGSEIMLRTALAIWEKLSEHICKLESADLFYSTMGQLTLEMSEGNFLDTEQLISRIYTIAPIPLPKLSELREKYTYNIAPFNNFLNSGMKSSSSMDASLARETDSHHPSKNPYRILRSNSEIKDEDLEDDQTDSSRKRYSFNSSGGIGCFSGIIYGGQSRSTSRPSEPSSMNRSLSAADISQVGPGAVSATPYNHSDAPGAYQERMTTNLSALQAQYQKLRNRQRKAALVLPLGDGGGNSNRCNSSGKDRHGFSTNATPSMLKPSPMASARPTYEAINHLFLGREHQHQIQQKHKNRRRKGSASQSKCGSVTSYEFRSVENMEEAIRHQQVDHGMRPDTEKNPDYVRRREIETAPCSDRSNSSSMISLNISSPEDADEGRRFSVTSNKTQEVPGCSDTSPEVFQVSVPADDENVGDDESDEIFRFRSRTETLTSSNVDQIECPDDAQSDPVEDSLKLNNDDPEDVFETNLMKLAADQNLPPSSKITILYAETSDSPSDSFYGRKYHHSAVEDQYKEQRNQMRSKGSHRTLAVDCQAGSSSSDNSPLSSSSNSPYHTKEFLAYPQSKGGPVQAAKLSPTGGGSANPFDLRTQLAKSSRVQFGNKFGLYKTVSNGSRTTGGSHYQVHEHH